VRSDSLFNTRSTLPAVFLNKIRKPIMHFSHYNWPSTREDMLRPRIKFEFRTITVKFDISKVNFITLLICYL